jgi:hypothetical protein
MRWSLLLQEFSFTVLPISGVKNIQADLLTRCVRGDNSFVLYCYFSSEFIGLGTVCITVCRQHIAVLAMTRGSGGVLRSHCRAVTSLRSEHRGRIDQWERRSAAESDLPVMFTNITKGVYPTGHSPVVYTMTLIGY